MERKRLGGFRLWMVCIAACGHNVDVLLRLPLPALDRPLLPRHVRRVPRPRLCFGFRKDSRVRLFGGGNNHGALPFYTAT
ncbi:hypothetical protein [uncultured Marinococcus sp.]|uniref:hypothetical protein n=1 Tax=uncultured Marinococcus sp. TaxID=487012 RepID=UPI0026384F50|nr:hypothetical protein [uncultured Marinococcus sp.]